MAKQIEDFIEKFQRAENRNRGTDLKALHTTSASQDNHQTPIVPPTIPRKNTNTKIKKPQNAVNSEKQ